MSPVTKSIEEIRQGGGYGRMLSPGSLQSLRDRASDDGLIRLDPDGVPVIVKACPGWKSGAMCGRELRFRCEEPPSPVAVKILQIAKCQFCILELERAEIEARGRKALEERRVESKMPRSLLGEVGWDSLLEHGSTADETERRRRAIEQAKEWAACRDFSGRKPGLLLYGEPGSGKTRLMATAAAARLEHSPIRWVSVGVLMAELQGAWNDEDRKQALKVLTGATAVALDDFDKVNPSQSMLAQLFTALDKREQARSPLLVTTNLKPSDLASKLGNVIASRLTGMCVVLPYPGPDRRLEIGRD
jgi:DNA replication protein DnaC